MHGIDSALALSDMPEASGLLNDIGDTKRDFKAFSLSRSSSPVAPYLLTVDSEADLTSDSHCSTLGEEAPWTVQDSAALYCVDGWGQPYFSINTLGHLCVHPQGGSLLCAANRS